MEIAKTIYSSKYTEFDVVYTPDVVYAHRKCGDLLLHVVSPIAPVLTPLKEDFYNPVKEKFARWYREHPEEAAARPGVPSEERCFPLIVDCPGSGWSGAEGYRHVPYLVSLAKQGFVAAAIGYRGTFRNNVTFPAAVQDMKEAVRFLRANADKYHIDKTRVGLMGDSSGGNTAAMAALTNDDDQEFNIGAHLEESSEVSCCCCVYGPVDLINLVQDRINEHKTLRPDEAPFPEGVPFEALEIWQEKYLEDPAAYMKAASPYYRIENADHLPPFLFVQGDEDPIIPMAQGLRFCEKLREYGGRAEFLKVAGAQHGTGVWSEEMLRYTADFFHAYLGR
ncbi:MAG: alpha/beta hydrolase [Lachnospiraceae bacterium]|nr:alpha/beta hydrolase [Lachnospiraceae bacterium]